MSNSPTDGANLEQMKSAIFYASKEELPNTQPIRVVGRDGVTTIYVRAVIVRTDCESALSAARPRDGEMLLNTMEL